ncbi:MAG: aspartate-semialdehyde dehydrogenase, partial [Candidatus Binatota bacterium]|nr:aspartate-semialdehyde dehydrogenase [Candidatus Binatota bacterium]
MKVGGARVAVVGATGLVGQEIVSLLAERELPIRELLLYASERSAGSEVAFGEDGVRVQRLPPELPQVDIAFLCAGAAVDAELADDLAAAGAVAIELSVPRGSPRPPLALVGWRESEIAALAKGGIVAVPDPLAQLLAVPLRAIGAVVPIR